MKWTEDNLKKVLVKCMSVQDVIILAKAAKDDPVLLGKIVSLAISGNNISAAKASWVLSKACEKFKVKMEKYIEPILTRIESECTSGIKRELMKALLYTKIHLSDDIRLFNLVLESVLGNEAIGVKYIALRHLQAYVKHKPELKVEIIHTLEHCQQRDQGFWNHQVKELLVKFKKPSLRDFKYSK